MEPIEKTSTNDKTRPLSQKSRSAVELLFDSGCLARLNRKIARAALSDVPVLIVGESGTGKELVANAIHESSHRAKMPFVCLNLAAVPVELAETVLFGHEKGAFTGASHASLGYCRKANRGTLFLDEIGEIDLLLQAKLLRFLQSYEIQPVGSETVIDLDVRVVAATNRDLESAVRDKTFREDLFYRLNVVKLHLPPLRERQDDIDSLIEFFLNEFNLKYRCACRLSESLQQRFHEAQWPGNIRQMRSVIESLILLSEHEVLGIQDLSTDLLTQIGTRTSPPDSPTIAAPFTELERLTYGLVESVLQQTKGHVSTAAQRLGISRATLYRWIKRHRAGSSGETGGIEK